MSQSSSADSAQQIVLGIFGPPVMSAVCWVLSRGWAGFVQNGEISERTKNRQKKEFILVLIAMYLIVIGMTVYAHVRP